MSELQVSIAGYTDTAEKVSRIFGKRMETAQERFNDRVKKTCNDHLHALVKIFDAPWDFGMQWIQYTTDFAQRCILYSDTLRRRGNNFIAHEQAGKPPVLHFQNEMLMDARTFDRPVNYALLRILPPKGVSIDARRRPYVIIDPRAGHGPGIGGFKDDSQAGVAMRAGHL
jgi:hypothetical protein